MSEPTRIQIPQLVMSAPPTEPGVRAQVIAPDSVVREYLQNRSSGRVLDGIFGGTMLASALSVFAIVGLIVFTLLDGSKLSIRAFGWKFFLRTAWDPVNGDFGALTFIFGTVASSLLALCIAVPLALGVAIFITEMCPARLRAPISFLTELLAAIPSVVYGLWALFILVPIMRDVVGPLLVKYLGWTGFFGGGATSASGCAACFGFAKPRMISP